MFLSEGCGGRAFVGHSTDLVSWQFREQEYLDLSELGGSLHEVACATVVPASDGAADALVLDFFYGDSQSRFAAGQALYSVDDPFRQKELTRGGSLAWGGLLDYQSTWTFPQGWDAPAGRREIYFYRSYIHQTHAELSEPKVSGNRADN
jgi:beta-1,2-mannosidase